MEDTWRGKSQQQDLLYKLSVVVVLGDFFKNSHLSSGFFHILL
jgi:hypothetical protein